MQEVIQTRDLTRRRPSVYDLRLRLLMAVAAVLFVVDRVLKEWARAGEYSGGYPISFELFMNHGTIFSIPLPKSIIIAISSILLVFFAAALVRSTRVGTPARGALLLIILGATSNLIDRISYGAVVDYLIFFGQSAVNIADGMIVVGILMLIFMERRVQKEKISEGST